MFSKLVKTQELINRLGDDQSSMSDTVITCGLQDVGTVYLEMVRMAKEGTREQSLQLWYE